MNFIIHFLLISGLSILITESNPVYTVAIIKKDMHDFIEQEQSRCKYPVWFLKDGWLGETEISLVWKGIYGNSTIAVKITADESSYLHEMNGFKALDATYNPNIEAEGIPRIYYNGRFLNRLFVIGMTLLGGTLEHHWKRAGNISELSILLICKQAVKILEYMSKKCVLHNDLKPENIFLHGPKVFISDFHIATLFGPKAAGHPPWFASMNFHLYPMDDLKALVFSLWYIAGMPGDRSSFRNFRLPLSKTLAKCRKQTGNAGEKMLEKYAHFRNPTVQEAFRLIVEEMLQSKPIPNYKRIIDILTDAIDKVTADSELP